MVGELSIADHICQTHIRFRNITDYESYINAIDQDYESEDAIFNIYIYKRDTPHFHLVNKLQYRNDCDIKHQNIVYLGNISFVPTKRYRFVKRIILLTGENYKEKYLDFLGKEKKTIKSND